MLRESLHFPVPAGSAAAARASRLGGSIRQRGLWPGRMRGAGLLSRGPRLAAFVLCLLFFVSGCSLHATPPPESASAAGSAISRTALSTVGTRYTYGGTQPDKGFDCSGLVCWSYARHGLKQPRTAKAQSANGAAVSRGALQPGDVVVFKTKSGMHTGIYTGKGRFVHSPGTGKRVRVDSLEDKYWRGCFVAGRRHHGVY